MDALDIYPEAQPQDSSSPPLHSNEGQEQELATHQQSKQDDDMARLPRIPRATDDCPQPMTIDEICDWKYKWKLKRRAPTRSERDDYSECDRQWHDAGSETTDDWEEDEKYMDGMPSPTQRSHPAWTSGYQAERDARKRPLSPPRTPPHLRASKLYTHRDPTLASQPGNSKVQKSKPNTRVAPRRPVTRASGTAAISLHHRKGYVKYWNVPWQYIIISYAQYVKDWVSSIPVCHQGCPNMTQEQGRTRQAPS